MCLDLCSCSCHGRMFGEDKLAATGQYQSLEAWAADAKQARVAQKLEKVRLHPQNTSLYCLYYFDLFYYTSIVCNNINWQQSR